MDNRELDRAIAEFLGWTEDKENHWWYDTDDRPVIEVDVFKPSSLSADCSLVLDEIERRGWSWKWVHNSDWFHSFDFFLHDGTSEFMADSDNRYRAVCEAALQAAEDE